MVFDANVLADLRGSWDAPFGRSDRRRFTIGPIAATKEVEIAPFLSKDSWNGVDGFFLRGMN
jgi:hypothetical protein